MSDAIRKTASLQSPYGCPLSDFGPFPSRSAGKTVMAQGYLAEFQPDHPMATKGGLVMQHRLVAEHVLGRHLTRDEVVHHEDQVKTNNAPENLWVFPTQAAHLRHHKRSSPRYDRELASRLVPLAADKNVSLQDAAKRLGVCVLTVRALIDVHGIPWVSAAASGLSEESVREALRGRTTLEAAKVLGVNHQTLRNRFPRLLQKRASPGFLDAHKEEIRSLATHTRTKALCVMFGTNPVTIGNAIARWSEAEPDAWSDVLAYRRLDRSGCGPQQKRKACVQNPT